MFENPYLISIYKMRFQYIGVCIVIYLSRITLNKIIDVILYMKFECTSVQKLQTCCAANYQRCT